MLKKKAIHKVVNNSSFRWCLNILLHVETGGLAKLGNVVAQTLRQTQMFPSLYAQETYVAKANLASWKQGNVSESSQKHFCFTDANFATERDASQFSYPRKHVWKQCFLV